MRELEVQEVVLRGDFAVITRTNLVTKDCVHNSDFGIMAVWPQFGGNGHKIGYSVSHTKRIKAEALVRLAESLDDMPQAEEIRARAYNARK